MLATGNLHVHLEICTANVLRVYVQNYFSFQFHHCVWFSNRSQETGMYINSERVSTLILKGFVSQGGRNMIFGQVQDDVNAGNLEENQAYK